MMSETFPTTTVRKSHKMTSMATTGHTAADDKQTNNDIILCTCHDPFKGANTLRVYIIYIRHSGRVCFGRELITTSKL